MGYKELLEEKRLYSKRFNDYVAELRERSNKNKLKEFAEMRGFKLDTIEELGIFYIGDAVELLLPKYLSEVDQFGVISPTNKKPIYHNRFVIPIKDVNGDMLNLVGYSKDADERYVYGTAKYYRRRDDAWGLENMHKAYEKGYMILTEGITDAMALRDIGYDVAFANCGTHGSQMVMSQANRCRYGLLEIPDRDPAGQKAAKRWKCNRYIRINTFIEYKDIDEMIHRAENGEQWVRSYIDEAIEWLKQKEHNGYQCESVEVTMY